MHRVAIALIFGLAAAWWPPPAVAQMAPPDPCATIDIEGISRLADDPKGRRYLVRFRDYSRQIAGSGTFRLDTMNAHVVAPFDGMMTIVRAPLDQEVVAAAIVSVQQYGRSVTCALHATSVQAIEPASDAAIVPHTRTFDAVPVPDPPITCERPFIEGSADHSVAVEAPAMARQQGISGIVTVSVLVDEHGKPSDARIVSSPSSILNAAALAAARSMTYSQSIYRCAPSPQGRALFHAHFYMPRRL
ncbi:MAG: energy transducer TonB [Candidatus Eremiobacteraeota bacterium]|nr:energy transducer TonB [Candidatus Eremiobacteraeota bacterium]